MKKELNKIFVLGLLAITILFFSLLTFDSKASNFSKNDVEDRIDELLTRQFDALITGDSVNTSGILGDSDSTQLYAEFLRWRITQAGLVDTLWADYLYDLHINSIQYENEEIIVTGAYDLDYTLKNGSECSQYDIMLTIKLEKDNDDYIINYIESSEVMFVEFSEGIKDFFQPNTRGSSNSISSATDLWINAISEMDMLIPDEEIAANEVVKETRASYSYSASKGVSYANTYYNNRNTSFYNAGADCTNFVSQCVWTAYGGTTSGIANKVRMTGTWYADSGGGSSAWESVEGFWNYVTSSKSDGPNGSGANNNKSYINITTYGISTGDILQVRTASASKYGHSVYVVYNGATSATGYASITVAQHTSNTKRSLADLISSRGGSNCYMRKIHFSAATFTK